MKKSNDIINILRHDYRDILVINLRIIKVNNISYSVFSRDQRKFPSII